MTCQHSVRSLLAKTQFAKDGPAANRSATVFKQFQIDQRLARSQIQMNIAKRMQNFQVGNMSLVGDDPHVSLDSTQLTNISDRGPFLNSIRGLLREYAQYEYDHGDIYDAAIELFGFHTMGPSAEPSDALAFITLAAVFFTIFKAAQPHSEKNFPKQVEFVSSICSVDKNSLEKLMKIIEADPPQKTRIDQIYELIIASKRNASTLVTDLLIELFGSFTSASLETYEEAIDPFMNYVAKIKQVSKSDAPMAKVTTEGDIVLDGEVFHMSGYSSDGILLSRTRAATDREGIACEVKEIFWKRLEDYNTSNASSVCAGCSLNKMFSENGRLSWYKNVLCSADLTTATNIFVHSNGKVEFEAQRLVTDTRTNKVLRTGLRSMMCDLYEMHMVAGFDVTRCHNLSCLFEKKNPEIIAEVRSEGVSVWAAVERMDQYECDELGRVRSIMLGGKKKYSCRNGDDLKWCESRIGAFTIDDIVK